MKATEGKPRVLESFESLVEQQSKVIEKQAKSIKILTDRINLLESKPKPTMSVYP